MANAMNARSERRKSTQAGRAARRRGGLILGLPESVWGRLYARDCGYETPCLVWSGTIASNGYGVVGIDGRQHKVHRLVYEAVRGPMPRRDAAGKRIVSDHLCRIRACAAPAHIDPVTDAVNVMRGIGFAPANAAKTHCDHGHEFTPENTAIYEGERVCIACKRAAALKSEAKRKDRRRAARAANPKTRRPAKATAPPRELAPCGTLAARLRHVRKDEPIDEACRAAHAERMRSWRRGQAAGTEDLGEIEPDGGNGGLTMELNDTTIARLRSVMAGESPLEGLDEYLIPTGAHWTLQGPDGMWVIRWNSATGTVRARRFDHGSPDGFSAEAADLPAARREVLRIAGLIADGKTREA